MTAKLHHFDLYGSRQSKYDALASLSLESIDWQELTPNAPYYLFMPQAQAYREEYEAWDKITDIFPLNVLGLNSHRDHFAIAFGKQELIRRFIAFRDAVTDQECYGRFALADNRDWKLPIARTRLKQNVEWQGNIISCIYRPFDIRECMLNEIAMDYPRLEVNRNMLQPNLSLVTTRQTREPFAALATNLVCGQHKIVSVYDGSFIFPLWRYPTEQEAAIGMEREANIVPAFIAALKDKIGETPTPEDIFHYAYAVFHAPTYRTRYAAFLKTDFPRLPLPPNADAFHALAALGANLVALHLLEAPELAQHGIGFPKSGDHTVKKMRREARYTPPTPGGAPGRVNLNDTEYFENVPLEAWEFQVGGYQPAFKWLDDRKERQLTEDDINHYRRMIAAMRETAHLLPAVDGAFQSMLFASSPDATQ